MPGPTLAEIVQRTQNENRVKEDINAIRDYVKENLFYKTIHIWDDEQLKKGGILHGDFMKHCKSLVYNGQLQHAVERDGIVYMDLIWERMATKKCYRDWFNKKRSNAYQAMQDQFLRLCIHCEAENKVLPSLESFQKRLDNPKINYLFYEYFLKAVMGISKWNRCHYENKRLSTNAAEAFAHVLLENNYFAWLFEYKCKNTLSMLKTEYEVKKDGEWEVFCGDLQNTEIKVPEVDDVTKRVTGGYVMLNNNHEDFDDTREEAEELQKEIVDLAQSENGKKRKFEEVKKQNDLLMIASNSSTNEKVKAKEKRRCLKTLKLYTGHAAAGSISERKYKGWSNQGKKFHEDLLVKIGAEVASGKHGKWEDLYKEIVKVLASQEKENIDDEDSELENYTVDYGKLYAEVLEVMEL